MTKDQAKKRIAKLREEINHHRYLYHVQDKTEISDGASDSLKNELFKLEQAYPELITPDSPTQRVAGQPLDKFRKVTHSTPMHSLFDAFSEQDMADWEQRLKKILKSQPLRPSATSPLQGEEGSKKGLFLAKEGVGGGYFCELKLDGLAVALRYKSGLFFQGATRGDGRVGEDVTQNLKTIESIPLRLRIPKENELKKISLNLKQIQSVIKAASTGSIEIRGEVVMKKKVLTKLNKKYQIDGKPLLKNPRNAAAGSIRQLDPKLAAERQLDFYVYEISTNLDLDKHAQKSRLAKLLGFKVLKENKYCVNLSEVNKFHVYWEKNKDKLPMLCDGLVVKVNEIAAWKVLGIVGKGPRYMMAYKFAAEQATTRLIAVNWQVGRTGILTPAAVLEPALIGGVTVSHATLHNMDEIKRLGLKIGDTVILERAGDVIPKIIKVLPKLRDGKEKVIRVPKKCPMCNSRVEKIPGEVAYRCPNKDCYAVNLRKLFHWASRGAVDVEGLGPKIIEQLVKEGLVSDVADLYTLTVGDLKPLERFADKSAENLVESIKARKEIELPRFLIGLGIHHVGEESAIELAKHFGSLNEIKNAKVETLESLYDFGTVMSQSIYDWFHDKKNIELLSRLKKSGVKIREIKIKRIKSKISGQSIVLTGSLNSLTREEAKAKIREIGGKFSSSVSKDTDWVVAGENPGSKFDKAKKLGVKIINEQEFIKLIK